MNKAGQIKKDGDEEEINKISLRNRKREKKKSSWMPALHIENAEQSRYSNISYGLSMQANNVRGISIAHPEEENPMDVSAGKLMSDYEKDMEKMIEAEHANLSRLKRIQEGSRSPGQSTVSRSPSISRPPKRRILKDEILENYPDSQINCELIQKPRRLKDPHFIINTTVEQGRDQSRHVFASTRGNIEGSEYYSSARIPVDPLPIKKPNLEGLHNFLISNLAQQQPIEVNSARSAYSLPRVPIRQGGIVEHSV